MRLPKLLKTGFQILIVVFASVVLISLILIGNSIEWTGFGAFTDASGNIQRGKTLWDWMELVLIPIVLFLLARFFSDSQRRSEIQKQENVEQANITQAYIDRMQNLILEKDLLHASEASPVVSIARTLTLTTLERLEGHRKATILIFLDEMRLIQGGVHKVISLAGADLSGVGAPIGLGFSDFSGADLSHANLSRAILDAANFRGADLVGVAAEGASFMYGDFSGADLTGVFLNGVNLFGAKFDRDTILPNGEHWNETDLSRFGAVFKDPYTEKEYRSTARELGYSDNSSSNGQ